MFLGTRINLILRTIFKKCLHFLISLLLEKTRHTGRFCLLKTHYITGDQNLTEQTETNHIQH